MNDPPPTSGLTLIGALYRHTDDCVFDDFPNISGHFPKISQDSQKKLSEGDANVAEHFPKIWED